MYMYIWIGNTLWKASLTWVRISDSCIFIDVSATYYVPYSILLSTCSKTHPSPTASALRDKRASPLCLVCHRRGKSLFALYTHTRMWAAYYTYIHVYGYPWDSSTLLLHRWCNEMRSRSSTSSPFSGPATSRFDDEYDYPSRDLANKLAKDNYRNIFRIIWNEIKKKKKEEKQKIRELLKMNGNKI